MRTTLGVVVYASDTVPVAIRSTQHPPMLEQGVRGQSNGYKDNRFYEEIIPLSLCIELEAVLSAPGGDWPLTLAAARGWSVGGAGGRVEGWVCGKQPPTRCRARGG